MGDQIPQLSPHAEVRKIGDLTLYIAYETTWNLVQVKCPTLGTKFCIKSLGNVPPIPVLGGVGLNIDRCISRLYGFKSGYVAGVSKEYLIVGLSSVLAKSCVSWIFS